QAKKLKIINSEVADFKPKKKLQVVTLFHVLEHIEEPQQLLKHIKAHIIERGGYLVIQVPNYDSIERHVFKEKWFSFDVPRHIWQFNEKVVADLLDKAGYSVKGAFKTNAPLHPVTIVPSINRELDIQRIWVKKNAHPLYAKAMTLAWAAMTLLTIPLTIVQNIVGRSSMLTVVAKPKED
ncbi:MAG TPA: class I SAM-dependent methyltransferase, partial [Candidatus Saccharimonadales bacterium]|nr:class I SAM-dependent methyltransferase [Candidatus Saccharimonadales bacterium]